MTTTQMVKLKVGQVWRSRDVREKRSVVIRGFEGDKVIVQNAAVDTGKNARKPATTKVNRDRFSPNYPNASRGYELEKDVT